MGSFAACERARPRAFAAKHAHALWRGSRHARGRGTPLRAAVVTAAIVAAVGVRKGKRKRKMKRKRKRRRKRRRRKKKGRRSRRRKK